MWIYFYRNQGCVEKVFTIFWYGSDCEIFPALTLVHVHCLILRCDCHNSEISSWVSRWSRTQPWVKPFFTIIMYHLMFRLWLFIMLKPLSHQSGVLTALKKLQNTKVRAVQTPATLCNHLERHAAAFTLSMLKTNAAAWRFHNVLDSTLWQRCGVF